MSLQPVTLQEFVHSVNRKTPTKLDIQRVVGGESFITYARNVVTENHIMDDKPYLYANNLLSMLEL
jgi:hypothetical protein